MPQQNPASNRSVQAYVRVARDRPNYVRMHIQLLRIYRIKKHVNMFFGMDRQILKRVQSSWHSLYQLTPNTIRALSKELLRSRTDIEAEITKMRRELELVPRRDLVRLVDCVDTVVAFCRTYPEPARRVVELRIEGNSYESIKKAVPGRVLSSIRDDYEKFLRSASELPEWKYLERKEEK